MKKTKKLTHYTVALAYMLCGSVFLSSTHARDIVKQTVTDYSAAPRHAKPSLSDVNAKALGELHNHTDHNHLKNISKAISDQPIAARERELRNGTSLQGEKSFMNMLIERLMYWRFAIAMRV